MISKVTGYFTTKRISNKECVYGMPLYCYHCDEFINYNYAKRQGSTKKCPVCIELELPDAHFCSQECFKKNWKSHNKVHKAAKERKECMEVYIIFNFQFSPQTCHPQIDTFVLF